MTKPLNDSLSVRFFSSACAERQPLQHEHQQRVAAQRYASLFERLAENGAENDEFVTPLVRAAFLRARTSPQQSTLLCRTAELIEKNFASVKSFRIFHGLEHSTDVRETSLDGLWNFQSFHATTEMLFNRWLTNQSSPCAICYLFSANQWKERSFGILKALFVFDAFIPATNASLLTCSQCRVRVHRQCYESICLALDVPIVSKSNPWFCQRCSLRAKVEKIVHFVSLWTPIRL